MTKTGTAVLIVNTKSRRGSQWHRDAIESLRQNGIVLVRTCAFRRPADLIKETRNAVSFGISLVIVGGGDGTLASVAPCFVGSRSTLGVLPLGTGNQFARDLGIEADLETACRVLAEGKKAKVDLGIINGSYFLNVATVGLTTRIAQGLTVDSKRRFGRAAYLFALMKALRNIRPFCARLITSEGEHTFETLQVVAGNGRFHAGPFPLAPEANITDGKLVIYALLGTSRWDLFRYSAHLPGGHHVDLNNVETVWTSAATLETVPVQRVTVDGEVKLKTPVEFGIAHKALPVMAPLDFKG